MSRSIRRNHCDSQGKIILLESSSFTESMHVLRIANKSFFEMYSKKPDEGETSDSSFAFERKEALTSIESSSLLFHYIHQLIWNIRYRPVLWGEVPIILCLALSFVVSMAIFGDSSVYFSNTQWILSGFLAFSGWCRGIGWKRLVFGL